jgi:hypothetical protein
MRLRSNSGLTATIFDVRDGVMLSLFDSRGHVMRRRRRKARSDAMDELWTLDRGWRVA